MKVGLVSPYDLGRYGGVQDQVLKLSEWLGDAGHETVVIGPGDGPDGTISLGPARVITVNGAAAPIRLDPRVRGALQETLGGCDVVHAHEPLMPMVGPAAAKVRGPALVGTFHADPSRAVRSLYRWGRASIDRIVRRFDVVTAVSPVAAGAVERFSRPLIVPNGLDVATYRRDPGTPGRVAFLGRDDPRKGLDVLLTAWPLVNESVPDAELVVAAGDRTGTIPGVRFIGAVDAAAKRDLLAGAAVFCAPNLGGESFGIILAEAMAAGCAVVASALPAFAHVLGDAGVLFKPADPEGLAGVLIDLLRAPDRIADFQQRGARRVDRFDRGAVLDGYLVAYTRAVDRHRHRSPHR
jgi:phosphatidylinositol alpha-mannosyltransferase